MSDLPARLREHAKKQGWEHSMNIFHGAAKLIEKQEKRIAKLECPPHILTLMQQVEDLEAVRDTQGTELARVKLDYQGLLLKHTALEATIQRVRELPEKWRQECKQRIFGSVFDIDDCAYELQAALEQDDE